MAHIKALLSSIYYLYGSCIAPVLIGTQILISICLMCMFSSSGGGLLWEGVAEAMIAAMFYAPFFAIAWAIAGMVPIPIVRWILGVSVAWELFDTFEKILIKLNAGFSSDIPSEISLIIWAMISVLWLMLNICICARNT